MNSIFEMAVALSQYSKGMIDSAYAASIITANLSSLDGLETSELRKLAQSVGFSLADVEWTGDGPELKEKSERLQSHLNQLVSERTSAIDVPEYLIDEFQPEQLLGTVLNDLESYELRKEYSSDAIFLCSKDSKNQLTGFRKFSCLDDLEKAVWEG